MRSGFRTDMLPLLTAISISVFALGVVAWIAAKLHRVLRPEAVDAGWWVQFNTEKYRPMEHLLSPMELRFLEEQPDCDFRMLWRFRSERARICLHFLREMKGDFERLQAVGQALVVANRCSEGFQDELFRQRLQFSLAWWRMRATLPLWRAGLVELDPAMLLEALRRSDSSVRLAFSPAG